MASPISEPHLTPSEFAVLPHASAYELVDGKLVERNMGNESDVVAVRLLRRVAEFVEAERLGWVFGSDAGFVLRPGTVRKPDVAFVRFGRLPNEQPARGYDELAPDLAVEVVSPRDIAEELDTKVEEYLTAGVRLVWVVQPATRTVRIHRQDGTVAVVRQGDALSGENVIPGFSTPVSDLFAFPRPPAAQ